MKENNNIDISPIDCELSEAMKEHIEFIEFVNEQWVNVHTKLGIPKDMLGSNGIKSTPIKID